MLAKPVGRAIDDDFVGEREGHRDRGRKTLERDSAVEKFRRKNCSLKFEAGDGPIRVGPRVGRYQKLIGGKLSRKLVGGLFGEIQVDGAWATYFTRR